MASFNSGAVKRSQFGIKGSKFVAWVKGHTELVYVSEAGDYKIVGETRDDAVGEAYDKVGRVMGLTYPAGREIDELAHLDKMLFFA